MQSQTSSDNTGTRMGLLGWLAALIEPAAARSHPITACSAAHTSTLSLALLAAIHCLCLLVQITSKTCKECVDFYYVWKKSSHYALWKNLGKPSKKPHANKEEQWKAIKGQMEGSGGAAAGATTGGAAVKKES